MNMKAAIMKPNLIILTLAVLLLAPPTRLHAAAPTEKPNIVLIMADDQGWGDRLTRL